MSSLAQLPVGDGYWEAEAT